MSTGPVPRITNLIIYTGATFTLDARIKIGGNITQNGTWIATNGTLELNGTSLQNIAGSYFYNKILKNLTDSNAAGLQVINANDSLKITGTIDFGNVNNSTINSGGNIVLISTAGATARVADVTNNLANSGNNFIGKVTVERFYPAKRAWRLVTSPLSNTGNIFNSWQAGAPGPTTYIPGRGMFVSGPNPNLATNGLDDSYYDNYSMKSWDAATSSYINIGNTLTQNLSTNAANAANIGYYTFVRGDRTRNPDNTIFGNTNITTLSSFGFLQTGTQTFNLTGAPGTYPLIGNPYASPIDFNKITKTNVYSNRFYVHDPTINALGAFVVMEEDLSNIGTFKPTNIPTSVQDNHIQSSQAFFVQVIAGGPPSVSFEENDKSAIDNRLLFRPATPVGQPQSFGITLLQADPGKATLLTDGALVQVDDNFNDIVDIQDALKFTNIDENLGLMRYNKILAVERRPLNKR